MPTQHNRAQVTALSWHQHIAVARAIEAAPGLVPPSLLLTKTTLSWAESEQDAVVVMVEQAIARFRAFQGRGHSIAMHSIARKMARLGLTVDTHRPLIRT